MNNMIKILTLISLINACGSEHDQRRNDEESSKIVQKQAAHELEIYNRSLESYKKGEISY